MFLPWQNFGFQLMTLKYSSPEFVCSFNFPLKTILPKKKKLRHKTRSCTQSINETRISSNEKKTTLAMNIFLMNPDSIFSQS